MTPGQKFKLICVLGYAAVIALGYAYADRHHPPAADTAHSKAARDIDAGHQIVADDIVSADQGQLVKNFAVHKIEKGKTITAKDVAAFMPNLKTPPAVAVTFTTVRDPADGDLAGREYQVCLAGKLVIQAKPLATHCDSQSCLIVLPLNRGQDLSLADAQRATVLKDGQKCGP